MHLARTGRVVKSIKAVTNMHHKYKEPPYTELDLGLFINILTKKESEKRGKKLADPRIDEIPAQCRDRIT
jgi:hypothetical protein